MASKPDSDPRFHPLKPQDAKRLARRIAEDGVVSFTEHARAEMEKDDLQSTDCLNLLRAGIFHEAELENKELRYRVSTQRMCVVFVFLSTDRLRVITAWRNR